MTNNLLEVINAKLKAEPDRRKHHLLILETIVDNTSNSPDNFLFGLAQIAHRAGADLEKSGAASTLNMLFDRLFEINAQLEGMQTILRFHITGLEGMGGNCVGMRQVLSAYKSILTSARKELAEVIGLVVEYHHRDTEYLDGRK